MNWYKTAKINKLSFDFKKFLLSIGGVALLSLVLSLGINESQFNNLMKKNKNDTNKVISELNKAKNSTNQNPTTQTSEEYPPEATREAEEPKTSTDPNTATPKEIVLRYDNFDYKNFANKLIKVEGSKDIAYDDATGKSVPSSKKIRGYITVGIGHKMTNSKGTYNPEPSSVKVFNEINERYKKENKPLLNHDLVMKGKQRLTKEQIIDIAEYDVKEHYNRAEKIFPKLKNYSHRVQGALLNGVYRGEFPTGSDVVKLINNNNWIGAVKAYLHRYDYLNAYDRNQGGIVPRMNENARTLLLKALEIGQVSNKDYGKIIRKMELYEQ